MIDASVFTLAEAKALVGMRFESRVPVLGMPAGTRGSIMRTHARSGGYMIVLKWCNAGSVHTLEGWFNKDQFLRDFLPATAS